MKRKEKQRQRNGIESNTVEWKIWHRTQAQVLCWILYVMLQWVVLSSILEIVETMSFSLVRNKN